MIDGWLGVEYRGGGAASSTKGGHRAILGKWQMLCKLLGATAMIEVGLWQKKGHWTEFLLWG